MATSRARSGTAEPPTAKDGLPVRLRPATRDDGSLMLAWQRHPETRRHARDPRPPTDDEHWRWLDAHLASPECLLTVILHDDRPAGVLRLDRRRHLDRAAPAHEVSILVSPDRHGRGIATAALKLARRLLPDAELVAHVAPENAASQRLFATAGYRFRDGWYRSPPGENPP